MKEPLTVEFLDRIRERRKTDEYNAMMRIMDVSRLHRDITRRESEVDGIPQSYRVLLFHLSNMEAGVTQLELVKAAHLKPPTVSVTLANMEKDGYITRRTGETDRRQSLVYLTDKGKGVNARIKDSFDRCDKVALGKLSANENRVLCALLDKVIDSMIDDFSAISAKEEDGGKGK